MLHGFLVRCWVSFIGNTLYNHRLRARIGRATARGDPRRFFHKRADRELSAHVARTYFYLYHRAGFRVRVVTFTHAFVTHDLARRHSAFSS